MVRRLLRDTDVQVFNLDKCGYASDCASIEAVLKDLGAAAEGRYQRLRLDLADEQATAAAVRQADPDLVLQLAAESHVDRSIDGPGAFLSSNVIGTFSLLQAVRAHWEALPEERRERFRFQHISTDEVFGSLGPTGRFSESTAYDPRSPYSASKAASDPCQCLASNLRPAGAAHQLQQQLRPWQFPKSDPGGIPRRREPIPLYGDGANARLVVCGGSR